MTRSTGMRDLWIADRVTQRVHRVSVASHLFVQLDSDGLLRRTGHDPSRYEVCTRVRAAGPRRSAMHRAHDEQQLGSQGRGSGGPALATRQWRPRVAIVWHTAVPDIIGGGEINLYRLVRHLDRQGYEVHFWRWMICSYGHAQRRPVDGYRTWTFDGLVYHDVHYGRLFDELRDWIERNGPVAVIAETAWEVEHNERLIEVAGGLPTALYIQYWQAFAASQYEVPEDVELSPGWQDVFDRTTRLWVNSEYVATRLRNASGHDPDVVTPVTLDALGESDRSGSWVLVGAGPYKGIDMMRNIAGEFPDERFLVLGQLAEVVTHNLRAVGFVDPRPYYLRAKALLAPSLVCETYGMAVEEARKYGVPAIVSDTGALADHAEVALPPRDVDRWTDAASSLLRGEVSVTGQTQSEDASYREFDVAFRRLVA